MEAIHPNPRQSGMHQSPSHDASYVQLVETLRHLVEEAQVDTLELDRSAAEMRSFLPRHSADWLDQAMDGEDAMLARLGVLCGLSAATLVRMGATGETPSGLKWEDWIRAVLDASGMTQLEDPDLRQLAYDVMVLGLTDIDEDQPESGEEDGVAAVLPTLNLTMFQSLQKDGRSYLGLV